MLVCVVLSCLFLVALWLPARKGLTSWLSYLFCFVTFQNVSLSTLDLRARFVPLNLFKVSKGAKIRNQYNQVPHLTQDTNWKVTNSQLYTTNESQEVSPFPACDHKAQINRRAQRHNKHKAEKRSRKVARPWNSQ